MYQRRHMAYPNKKNTKWAWRYIYVTRSNLILPKTFKCVEDITTYCLTHNGARTPLNLWIDKFLQLINIQSFICVWFFNDIYVSIQDISWKMKLYTLQIQKDSGHIV